MTDKPETETERLDALWWLLHGMSREEKVRQIDEWIESFYKPIGSSKINRASNPWWRNV